MLHSGLLMMIDGEGHHLKEEVNTSQLPHLRREFG